MSLEAILCPECGAKIKADRERCPRCRAWLVTPDDPEAAARNSRRILQWTGGIVAAFALGIGGLWLSRSGGTAAVGAAPGDPLAVRRQNPPAKEQSARAPSKPAERPFLDASGAGALAYANGNYVSALEQYRAAVEKNPNDAESLSNLGQVLVRLGRAAEALPHFDKAILLIPDRWAYHFNRARAFSVLGRWDESIAGYREAQRLFPDDHVTVFNLALTLHKKGDDAAAVEEYRRAIELSPQDASFHYALALSYERLRRAPEAVKAYEEYLRLAPSATDADRIRARIARLTGASTPAAASSSGGETV